MCLTANQRAGFLVAMGHIILPGRKTHLDDSNRASTQKQAVCQAEQITTVEPDRCTVGLLLAQMEAHTFSS